MLIARYQGGEIKWVMVRTLVVALIMIGSGKANAGASESGNMLFDQCNDKGQFFEGVCVGYIVGISDALAGASTNARRACVPDDSVTNRQLRDIAVNYLKNHPEVRHYSASSVIAEAFAEAFPCK